MLAACTKMDASVTIGDPSAFKGTPAKAEAGQAAASKDNTPVSVKLETKEIEEYLGDAEVVGVWQDGYLTNGTYRTDFTALRTTNWVLLNGGAGASTCDALLPAYQQLPGEAGFYWHASKVALAISGWDSFAIKTRVHIPRFDRKPQGLSQCLGYRWDAKTKSIFMGTRMVAFLADVQPGWSEPE